MFSYGICTGYGPEMQLFDSMSTPANLHKDAGAAKTSYSHWKMAFKLQMKDFTLKGVIPIGKELGRGAYGKVFTVKYLGLVCAAKEIHSLLLDGVDQVQRKAITDSFIRECVHCNAIRHPNIVQFLGVYFSSYQSDLPIMVMELMDTGLASFIDQIRLDQIIYFCQKTRVTQKAKPIYDNKSNITLNSKVGHPFLSAASSSSFVGVAVVFDCCSNAAQCLMHPQLMVKVLYAIIRCYISIKVNLCVCDVIYKITNCVRM